MFLSKIRNQLNSWLGLRVEVSALIIKISFGSILMKWMITHNCLWLST